MKGRCLALLLAWAAATGPCAAAPMLLNTSHTGAVTDLAYDAARGLLVSAGEDGTVRVWGLEEQRLLAAVRVSHRPVQAVALHPQRPQFAALVGERLRTDTLCVWDWQRGGELFRIEGDNQLLHVAYSPLGSYLFYSKAAYESLVGLDPDSGRVLPFLRRGFGIVSYFTIARNEANLMTYQPSGALSYWDIRSGDNLRQLRTLPDLSTIEISANNRFVAAGTADELLVVDVLSGEVAARARAAVLSRPVFSPEGNRIAAVVADGQGGRRLRHWYFGARTLLELGSPPGFPVSGFLPTSARYTGGGLVVAERSGTIRLAAGTQASVLARDVRRPIHDLAFRGSRLAVATDEEIVLFESPVFSDSTETAAAAGEEGTLRQRAFANPVPGPTAVEFLEEDRLLVSTRGDAPGQVYLVDTGSGGSVFSGLLFASPLKQLTASAEGLIAVESSGQCRILEPGSFEQRFLYTAPGMNKLVFVSADMLLGGKTGVTRFSAPLLQINRRTGETVPIEDPSLFVYDLLYNEQAGAVYCLGVEEREGGPHTVLRSRSGYNFERSRVLQDFRGEDLGASLVLGDSGRVYSSLGFGRVREWRGTGGVDLQASGGVPRRLYVHGSRLYSLNSDSSVSVWDVRRRTWLMDLHLLADGGWVALAPDGRAFSSEGAQRHVSRGLP